MPQSFVDELNSLAAAEDAAAAQQEAILGDGNGGNAFSISNSSTVEQEGKPYLHSRPSYAPVQVETVWQNAIDISSGNVFDPSGQIIIWDRSIPRAGQWDMGHTPGNKYSLIHDLYVHGDISKEQFLKWYRNPENYRPELPETNRSHLYE